MRLRRGGKITQADDIPLPYCHIGGMQPSHGDMPVEKRACPALLPGQEAFKSRYREIFAVFR